MVAQNDWDGVLQPQLVLRNKVNGSYNQQWQLSNRFIGLDEQQDFSLQFIDIMHLSSFVIGDNQRLGLGIQYRFQDNFDSESLNEFRITEQFISKNSMENGHSAHRFRIEQRIFPKTTLHRFRYRFSRDLPLQGQD
ncbi:MAG: DUF2490 domain-containing protein, partial [Eudoraea sp.]|nr:DUF2490 domain-containing protein [Eudoraea sp.]